MYPILKAHDLITSPTFVVIEAAVGDFVDHDNHHPVHESLGNVTPADAHFGGAPDILEERRKIKERTIRERRLPKMRQPA